MLSRAKNGKHTLNLILKKISEIGATRCQILRLKCSAPPDPLAIFKGPTSKGKKGEGEERRVREGEGMERGGEGRERGRRGKGGENDLTHPLLQIPGYATGLSQYVVDVVDRRAETEKARRPYKNSADRRDSGMQRNEDAALRCLEASALAYCIV